MKSRNILTVILTAIVSLFLMIAIVPTANAQSFGVSLGPVTASTNTSATASTGTNSYQSGNGLIDSVYITKSATNSTIVWITTEQGVTVYSNTLVNVTSAFTRPRVFPTDLGGTAWGNTNVSPIQISFSGLLTVNAYSAVGTNHTVGVQINCTR